MDWMKIYSVLFLSLKISYNKHFNNIKFKIVAVPGKQDNFTNIISCLTDRDYVHTNKKTISQTLIILIDNMALF